MSQYSRTHQCWPDCKSCGGPALKLPALSHSSHFIKPQACEPQSAEIDCVCFFVVYFFFIFSGDIVNIVYEVEVSPGHVGAGHESWAFGLHFTNKLSLLQTGGKTATHFLSNSQHRSGPAALCISAWQQECARSRSQRLPELWLYMAQHWAFQHDIHLETNPSDCVAISTKMQLVFWQESDYFSFVKLQRFQLQELCFQFDFPDSFLY